MELVPILSTIILVGTIATFILAVAAYILYKIRERKAREAAPPAVVAQPQPHVLVQPQPQILAQPQPQVATGQPAPASIYAPTTVVQAPPQPAPQAAPQLAPAQQQGSMFWEYTPNEGFVPVSPNQPAQSAQRAQRDDNGHDNGFAWL